MSVETMSPESIERECKEVLPYEEYREVCDDEQPTIYRKTGVGTLEDYNRVSEDENTVYIELWGKRVPLFVRLENAGGYDVERTKDLAGVEDVYSLALPLEIVTDLGLDLDTYLSKLGKNAAVVIETEAKDTNEMKRMVSNTLDGGGWKVGDFLDTRCPEGEQVARISLYEAEFEAFDDLGHSIPFRGISWKEAYEEEVREAKDFDTVYMEADVIRRDYELFEELWKLHDEKFDWLGQYHPVSMQEGKSFFRQVVTNDNTGSIERLDYNEKGEMGPAGHGIFMDGMRQIDWVNDSFMYQIEKDAASKEENIVFFYGVASKSSVDKKMHYAKDIMALITRLAQRRGGKVRLLFESTTMSSQYIPDLVEEYTSGEPRGMTMVERVKPISQVDYWFISSGNNETV